MYQNTLFKKREKEEKTKDELHFVWIPYLSVIQQRKLIENNLMKQTSLIVQENIEALFLEGCWH